MENLKREGNRPHDTRGNNEKTKQENLAPPLGGGKVPEDKSFHGSLEDAVLRLEYDFGQRLREVLALATSRCTKASG